MKNNIKAAIGMAAVMGVGNLALAGNVLAAPHPTPLQATTTIGVSTPPQVNHRMRHKKMKFHQCRKQHKNAWKLGLRKNKNITESDAKTLVKAALLMRNRHDLRVGDLSMTKNKRGVKVYLADIINAQNKVASRVIVNSKTGRIRPVK